MTGHDLDLAREIREAAETWLYDGDADQPLPGYERLYDLADEVESLRAKLAAAERDRDRFARTIQYRVNELDASRRALTAVRELAEPRGPAERRDPQLALSRMHTVREVLALLGTDGDR